MPIVRQRLDFEGRFTQIPNDWLRDTNLSLKAKGLLAQLLSHADGWSVSIQGLAKVNNCGKDAIRSAVKELEDFGYLSRIQNRTDAGEFGDTVWVTSAPIAGSPIAGNPTPVNPTPKNTNDKNTNSKLALFDKFWSLYPRKVGKASARRAFLSHGDQALAIIGGLDKMLTDPNLPPTQFIPYPATWLNREGWEDAPYPVRESTGSQPVAPKSPYVGGPREWVKDLHDIGEHYECQPGEFGH
jgi:hypothetical protein